MQKFVKSTTIRLKKIVMKRNRINPYRDGFDGASLTADSLRGNYLAPCARLDLLRLLLRTCARLSITKTNIYLMTMTYFIYLLGIDQNLSGYEAAKNRDALMLYRPTTT